MFKSVLPAPAIDSLLIIQTAVPMPLSEIKTSLVQNSDSVAERSLKSSLSVKLTVFKLAEVIYAVVVVLACGIVLVFPESCDAVVPELPSVS